MRSTHKLVLEVTIEHEGESEPFSAGELADDLRDGLFKDVRDLVSYDVIVMQLAPQSTLEREGVEVGIYHSVMEHDAGKLVVQVDTLGLTGPVRVNVNDGAIWDADPNDHKHTPCACTDRMRD